ncbi:MAG: hypothetical protein ACPLRN_00440 [Microgenomates group bacterium]
MSREIIHSLILIFSVVLTFIFPKTNLGSYDLQIAAFLFIVLYLTKKFFIKNSSSKLIESVIFTLVVLGIVNTTGGVNSPFFFLIYFLLFSVSLLLEPIISITLTLTLISFYLLMMPQNQDFKSLLPILSLAFLTPFALYLGKEYEQIRQLTKKNQQMEENNLLFLTLIIKNHLKNISQALENFMGDHELTIIKKSVSRMEKLIEKYEKDH